MDNELSVTSWHKQYSHACEGEGLLRRRAERSAWGAVLKPAFLYGTRERAAWWITVMQSEKATSMPMSDSI